MISKKVAVNTSLKMSNIVPGERGTSSIGTPSQFPRKVLRLFASS